MGNDQKNKAEDRIKIISNVPNEKLPMFYYGSSLFCYPSHFEGFGLPITEALFCGSPVITSEGSCFPEAAGEGAVYVDPNKVDELAWALRSVLSDSQKLQEMAQKGSLHVEKFHWCKTTENLVELYRDLVGKPNPSRTRPN